MTVHYDGPATQSVLLRVRDERQRQEALVALGRFPSTCAGPDINDYGRLAVLTEEVGEVARNLCERMNHLHTVEDKKLYDKELREELIQVAAVAVAWCEAIDRRSGK